MADIEKTEETAVENSDKADKKPAEKTEKKKPSLGQRIGKFFREYKSELKKVVWATKEQTLNNFVLVAVAVVITSVCIGLLDLVFNSGITALGNLI